MIKIFKQNMMVQLVVILTMTAVMWIGGYIEPVQMPEPGKFAPLYQLLYGWLSGTPMLATTIGLVILLGEALLLNEMLYEHKMVSQNTLMPAFFYIVLMSGVGGVQTLTPILMVNLMIILGLRNIIRTSKVSMTLNMTFGTAAYIALATMFYFPSIVLIVPLLMMFPLYQLYGWRDWMVMILGLLAPYIPLTCWYMFSNELWGVYGGMWDDLMGIGLNFEGNVWTWIGSGYIALYILVIVFSGFDLAQEHPTAYQKNAFATMLPMVGGLLAMPFAAITPLNTQLFAVGLSFLATSYFQAAKKKIVWYELSLAVLLAILVVNIYV